MRTQHIFGGIILSASLLLGACATDTTSGTTEGPVNDAALTNSVTQAVHGVPGVNASDLNVSIQNGVVTLRGRTQTRTQAQDAIEAARHVPGVQKVDYDISVDEH